MLRWDEVVGREEKRMLRLPRKHQIAYGSVCADHALFQMDEYLAVRIRKESHALVKETVKTVWVLLAEPEIKKSLLLEKRMVELYAIWPDDDDPVHIPGWGDILQAVTWVCEMVNGKHPKEYLLDCVGYAYQGVRQMAKVLKRKSLTTEAAIRDFERKNPLCQAELEFQLEQLKILESKGRVESAIFPAYGFPPR